MNKLYLVKAYSFRNNEWVRWLVTVSENEAKTGKSATNQIEATFEGTDFKVKSETFICNTDDAVWQEH